MKRYIPLLAIIATTSSANAILLVDNFSNASSSSSSITVIVTGNPATQSPASLTSSSLSGVVGGSRFIQVTRQSSGTTGTREVKAEITDANQLFEFSSTPQANGRTTLGYGTVSDLNLDLSDETLFRMDFNFYDFPSSIPLPIALTVRSGITSDTVNTSISASSGLIDLSFSDFTGINFSDVDELTFVFDAPQAADFQLNSISTVPEPSSTALLGGGLLALCLRRRR